MRYNLPGFFALIFVPLFSLALFASGCGPAARSKSIRVTGSDAMINLALKWANQYSKDHPAINIQVSSGGPGRGIGSLIYNTCDLVNMSRKMTEAEMKQVEEKRGVGPVEHIVGYDAIVIYVSKKNPLESISFEESAEIYGEGGKITKWSQLGIAPPDGKDEIVLASRLNTSSTYTFFRETVIGETAEGKEHNYKPGVLERDGSKDVVTLVAHSPAAIGYSSMGYKTGDVKELKVSRKKGEPGVEPTVENTKNDVYPITRPLRIYSVGEPAGEVKEYLDWIASPAGQQIVVDEGYVSLTPNAGTE